MSDVLYRFPACHGHARGEAEKSLDLGALRLALLAFARDVIHACGVESTSLGCDAPEGSRGPVSVRSDAEPLAGLVDTYVATQGENNAPRYMTQVRALLLELGQYAGIADWVDLTRDHIEAWLEHIRLHGRPRPDGRKNPRKAGAKTRKSYIYAIRAFLGWAIDSERGRFHRAMLNPADRVAKPRHARKKGRAATAAEMAALLDSAPWERMVFYRVLAVSAMRVGAATSVPAAWFMAEADEPRIDIPQEMSKTWRGYSPALDPLTAKLVRIYKASRDDFSPSLPLFAPVRNDRMRRDVVAAGIQLKDDRGRAFGFNSFRRFTATELDRQGFNASIAQAQLGHSNVSTTLTYYTDTNFREQQAAASALSAAISVRDAGSKNATSQVSLRKPVDGTAIGRHTPSASRLMYPPTQTSSHPDPAFAAGRLAIAKGEPVGGDEFLPAPSGTSSNQVGATGLEPVARDLPPEIARLANRLMDLIETYTRPGQAEEPARVEPSAPDLRPDPRAVRPVPGRTA